MVLLFLLTYDQYPHQWLWDSCFHAMILANYSVNHAKDEIRALLSSQWNDGFIPHIGFDPAQETNYKPNSSDWVTGHLSSGITQPPLLATAVRYVYQKSNDKAFLLEVLPSLFKYHLWIKENRDLNDDGLAVIVHPWESGMDNSPIFDSLRNEYLSYSYPKFKIIRTDLNHVNQTQRPKDNDYQFYWGLVNLFKKLNWDHKQIVQESPFVVADTLFNSIWAKANEDLSCLANEAGFKNEASLFQRLASQTKEAVRKTLWSPDDNFFYSYDVKNKKQIPIKISGGFMPLYAGVPSQEMAEKLIEHLTNKKEFWSNYGITSVSMDEASFNPECYWRGPVWINIHGLLAIGLNNYGYDDIAKSLGSISKKLVQKSGYRENYHPFTGDGLGAKNFGWSTLADIM